jgi:hypothetical protein
MKTNAPGFSMSQEGALRSSYFLKVLENALPTIRDLWNMRCRELRRIRIGKACRFCSICVVISGRDVSETQLQLLRQLLREQWHDQHEWIVDALLHENDRHAIPVLAAAAEAEYPDLDDVDQTSLRNRCVYAIRDLGGPMAEESLEKLAKHQTEVGPLAVSLIRKLRLSGVKQEPDA